MIYEAYPEGEDLQVFIHRPSFEPVRYQHVKRGTFYIVISDNEYHLNEFSPEDSIHPFPYRGQVLACKLQFSGGAADEAGRVSRYAGPIVVYVAEADGSAWMRPRFEFHDGRFTLA